MSKPRVYLCGPITGETYDAAVGWRREVRDRLAPEIDVLSPLRAKEYLRGLVDAHDNGNKGIGDTYEETLLSGQRSITDRDRMDTLSSKMIISNLLPAEKSGKVSIGSCVEFGWADAYRIPIVTVMNVDQNVHNHGMLREMSSWIVEDLDKAVAIVRAVLIPGA